tara:strand:+ start:628 stop:795 length:168 start_codon:yes stop_codon:yes gene_type:complete
LRHSYIGKETDKTNGGKRVECVSSVPIITVHKSMAMVRRYAHLKQAVNPALIGHK